MLVGYFQLYPGRSWYRTAGSGLFFHTPAVLLRFPGAVELGEEGIVFRYISIVQYLMSWKFFFGAGYLL